jgi:hypothetical protein
MATIDCEFCSKIITKKNLKAHQRTAICRRTQGNVKPSYEDLETQFTNLQKESEVEIVTMQKQFDVEFVTMQKEFEVQVAVLQKELEIYRNLYGKLEEKFEDDQKDTKKILTQLASKPTVTNTQHTRNTQNNNNQIFQQLVPLDLSVEQILALGEVTLEQFQQGAKGAVEWMRPMLTDDNGNFKLHITDKNRGRLEFKNLDGTKETDVNCEKIMEVVKPLLEPQLLKLKKSLDLIVIDQYAYDEEANQVGGLVSRKIKETKTLKANFMDNKLVFKELQKQKA